MSSDTSSNTSNDVSMESSVYTIDEATDKIRKLVEDLKSHGIKINSDEMNFGKTYQIILKIDKEQ